MQPVQQTSIRTGYLAGEFLTSTYRISGEVSIHSNPLLDELNDVNALFVTVERMFVSPLFNPTVLTGNYRSAEVRKDRLGLVVLNQRRDGLPLREGRYVGRDHVERSVLLVAAGFEVRGLLTLHKSVNIPTFIRTTPEDFIPIFDATATLAVKRDVVFRGGAILVNRRRLEVFALSESDAGSA